MTLIPRWAVAKRARWKIQLIAAVLLPATLGANTTDAHAHGFNANRVRINRMPTGLYRVNIAYTHVEVGEYREAHVDFNDKAAAIAAYQQLAQGADFFLGDLKKSIHFHTPPQKNAPY